MNVTRLNIPIVLQDAEGGCPDHDGDEVDLTGLMESIVDSDEEEDLAESIDVSSRRKIPSLWNIFLPQWKCQNLPPLCWYNEERQ